MFISKSYTTQINSSYFIREHIIHSIAIIYYANYKILLKER